MAKNRGPTWEPKAEDYRQVIREQNPWHGDGKIPTAWARSVERPLAQQLWRRIEVDQPHRFQLILGPRRVGKTTSMYQTVKHLLDQDIYPLRLWWLRLDHPLLMDISLGDLCQTVLDAAEATQDKYVYIFLDELAYAEKWDLWLKTFYDEHWPVRVVGSSSSTAVLRDRRQESGVGRWEEQYLAPYLFTEFLELVNYPVEIRVAETLAETIRLNNGQMFRLDELADLRRRFLLIGGFPELLITFKDSPTDEASTLLESQRTLRNDAVERAVYKDIPQAFGVDNPMTLERVLYTLAGQITGVLSPSDICQNLLGMSAPTFERYLSYLERSFLVFTLPNYSGNETTTQKRGRRLYFVDGAVRNAALQRGVAPLGDTAEMGLLLENLVAGHLHALSQQSQVRMYHWRHRGEEVDLVYDHPERPLAFEIGSSARHPRTGLYRFMEQFPRFKNRCFIVAPNAAGRRPEDSTDHVGSVPLDLLLLCIGGQAAKSLEFNLAP